MIIKSDYTYEKYALYDKLFHTWIDKKFPYPSSWPYTTIKQRAKLFDSIKEAKNFRIKYKLLHEPTLVNKQ